MSNSPVDISPQLAKSFARSFYKDVQKYVAEHQKEFEEWQKEQKTASEENQR